MTELFHFQTGRRQTTRTALFSIANSGQMWWKLLKKVRRILTSINCFLPRPADAENQ
jgi:hypothetical protein